MAPHITYLICGMQEVMNILARLYTRQSALYREEMPGATPATATGVQIGLSLKFRNVLDNPALSNVCTALWQMGAAGEGDILGQQVFNNANAILMQTLGQDVEQVGS